MSEELSKEKQEDTKEAAGLNKEDDNATEGLELRDKSKTAETEIDNSLETEDEVEDSEKIARVVAKVIEQKFSGPIPPPNIIAGYENVLPGVADRIIKMAEQQSLHRQTIQLMETKAEVRDSFLGVIFAFGLGIGCLIACIITVIMVPESAGAICGAVLGVTGIGSIVAAFLKNTRLSGK